MKTLISIIVILMLCNSVSATEHSIYFSGVSYHASYEKNLNEKNNFLGIRFNDFNVLFFKNSFYQKSHAVFMSPKLIDGDYFSFMLWCGAVKGYTDQILPFVLPILRVNMRPTPFEFNISWVPHLDGSNKSVFALTINYTIRD